MSARRSIAAGANFARHWLWQKDIRLERRGARLLVSVTLVVAAMVAEISVHFDALSIPHLLRSDYVTVFYNVPKLNLAGTDGSLALVMIYAAIARTLFGIVIAIADAVFYCKITKRPFDWESIAVHLGQPSLLAIPSRLRRDDGKDSNHRGIRRRSGTVSRLLARRPRILLVPQMVPQNSVLLELGPHQPPSLA